MPRIGLLSDTHGYLDDRILHYLSQCDEVWHVGDWGGGFEVHTRLATLNKPIRGVYGNIDGRDIRQTYPEILRFNCDMLSVFMIHIGGYPGHYSKGVKILLQKERPDIFITGHSHILKVMRDRNLGILHLNPGAAGVHGFHKMRTLIRFEINGQSINNVQVVELGERGTLKKVVE